MDNHITVIFLTFCYQLGFSLTFVKIFLEKLAAFLKNNI
jgi:hypothetical protein